MMKSKFQERLEEASVLSNGMSSIEVDECLAIVRDYTREGIRFSEGIEYGVKLLLRAIEMLGATGLLKLADTKTIFHALFNLGYEAGSLAQLANELEWANKIVDLNPWIEDDVYSQYFCRYCKHEEYAGHAEDCLYLEAESFIESFVG